MRGAAVTERDRPLRADGQVDGQLVEPVVPPTATPADVAADRARGRTAIQASLPTYLVVVLQYVAGFFSIDLDPRGPGTDMPATASAALVGILTYVIAVRMNPKPGSAVDAAEAG